MRWRRSTPRSLRSHRRMHSPVPRGLVANTASPLHRSRRQTAGGTPDAVAAPRTAGLLRPRAFHRAVLKELKTKDRHLWDQAYRSLKDAGLAFAEGGKRRKLDRAYF